MDVTLLNTSVFDIPSSRRVGAIVHDGAADMRLWPGPGWDRELGHSWGPGLSRALESELRQTGQDRLPIGGAARVHRGKLHCDFLLWVATRVPEPGAERAPAPDVERIETAVLEALRFAAERSVERIAFPPIGDGPGELAEDERLAAVVRAAHRYQDRCFAEGRAPVVEEVLVCSPSPRSVSSARRKVSGLATAAEPPRPAPAEPKKKPARRRAVGARKKRAPAAPRLDPEEAARMRAASDPYDRSRTYEAGQWFVHPKFGAGRVENVTPEGAIEVLFEDGAVRKMIHGR